MTTTDPRRLDAALDDTLRAWPALTGQAPPPAIFCGAVDEVTGDWCRRLVAECRADQGEGQHSYDGLDPWANDPKENDR